jgi:prevent-host-death family protein
VRTLARRTAVDGVADIRRMIRAPIDRSSVTHTNSARAKSGAMIGAMDLSSDIEPVTALKRSAADLIARATDRHSPIVITQNGKPTAVLQDVHSYQRQQRALHLLKLLAQGEHDHRAGRVHDQASVDELVSARLAERRGAS